jgi:hypothetical protein|eukprot:5728111-Prymnesium_polylepis.1
MFGLSHSSLELSNSSKIEVGENKKRLLETMVTSAASGDAETTESVARRHGRHASRHAVLVSSAANDVSRRKTALV